MKRITAIMMVLVLLLLCCVTAQADEVMIRFLDIVWGKDLETMSQELKDAGWINDEGVELFASYETLAEICRSGEEVAESLVPIFEEKDGHYTIITDESEKNALTVFVEKQMILKDWMGVEVDGIDLIFALAGKEEKLISADIILAANEVDLRPELEKLYGEPADVGEDGTVYWIGVKNGEKKSILAYNGGEALFSLLDAKGKAQEAQPSAE